jgi:hypothetical protein
MVPARIDSCSPALLPMTRISRPICAPSGNSESERGRMKRSFFGS